MKVTFPAMRAHMGGRVYFLTTMALSELPRFFKFNDWESMTPELRAQRTINTARIPAITKYIVENEDNYLFSSITCSYACDLKFEPIGRANSDLGHINLELENMEFVINDGQHRCTAIAQAVEENPELGNHQISVLLFPMENLDRMQQMFSDLNRYANRTSKSLNVLYDHRDQLGGLTRAVVERVDAFYDLVDFEKATLAIRSPKLFTLAAIYDANKELLGRKIPEADSEDFAATLDILVDYWQTVAVHMKDWVQVVEGSVPPAAVRQEKISTHTVVLRALGSIGNILLSQDDKGWKKVLIKLETINWRKSQGGKVNPLWDGACITAGSVVSNKQARLATFNQVAKCLEIDPKKIASIKNKRRGRPRKSIA